MPAFVRAALYATSALIAVPSHAATAADPQPETSAGTGASDASPEIVVTARHTRESAQAVPLAIAVIGGEHIDNTGAFNVGRLQQLTPTLQFYSSNPRNSSANVRGLGAPFGLTNDGIEQGVGIYVDDVYYSRAASSTFDFLDVARIEVLRGPQGTLYGKNTTAGALSITSRQPAFTPGGRVEISAGNLGFRQAKAAVTGPLSSTLAARFAVSITHRDGSLTNTTTRTDVNQQDNLGLRAQLLWKPGNGIEATLAGDYSAQNPVCCATVYAGTGATQRPQGRQFAALAAAFGYQPPSTDPFARLTDLDSPLRAKNRIGGTSLRLKLPLGAGTLTSISAWRFWKWDPSNDRDFTGLPITTKSQNPSQQEQWTEELRYNRQGPALDFQAGLFGFWQTVRTQGLQVQGAAASRWLIAPSNPLSNDPSVLNGLTATNTISLDNGSFAAFAQATWKVTGRFHIQPGLRLNYDDKKGSYASVVTDGAGHPVVFAASNTARQKAQLAVLAPQAFAARFKSWNLSGDLTFAYDLAPDVHAYATYAHGFKSGGINLNGVPADDAGNPLLAAATVLPERIDHAELGLKTQVWGRKITLNLAAFRTDVHNYQAQVTNGQLGVLRGYLANAPLVRTQGIEGEFSVRPSPRFNAYANAAWTDAKYVRFPGAPCPPELSGGTTASAGQSPSAPGTPGGISPASCDISGQVLPGVSKWALSFGGEGNAPLAIAGSAGELYLGVDGSYRSRWSSNPSPSAYTWIAGAALTNLRLGWRDTRSGFNLFGWVRNAFDVKTFDQLQLQSGNTGLIVGSPADPRTYGVTVKAEF